MQNSKRAPGAGGSSGASVGHTFGDYVLLKKLARGAVGETFVARPLKGPNQGQRVCLKVLRPHYQAKGEDGYRHRQVAIDSLRREARVMHSLQHPHIARALDFGAYGDVWFVTFELVEGANLAQLLHRCPEDQGLPPDVVRAIGMDVADALACAHARDILHRDIKPGNILVSRSGEVKLVDFGLAKLRATRSRKFTRHVGTPRYWAPEQVLGQTLSAQTDIYALGVVLLELLTQQHPYTWDDPEDFPRSLLEGGRGFDLSTLSIPKDLREIIEGCLRPHPRQRHPSAIQLVEMLRAGSGQRPTAQLAALAIEATANQLEITPSILDDDSSEPDASSCESREPPVEPHNQETRIVPAQVLGIMAADAVPATDSAHGVVLADLGRLMQLEASEPSWEASAQAQAPCLREPPWRRVFRGLYWRVPVALATVGITLLWTSYYEVPTSDNPRAETAQPSPAAPTSPAPSHPALALGAPAQPPPAAAVGDSAGRAPGEGEATPTASPSLEPNTEPRGSVRADRKPRAARLQAAARPATAALPATPARVQVRIGLIPAGQVYVDGRDVGRSPVELQLPLGSHHIQGRLNRLRVDKRIDIGPDPQPIVLDLRHAESSP